MPSGKSLPAPAFPTGETGAKLRLVPGLRVFWYSTDPLAEHSFPVPSALPEHPWPVVYAHETDLSKTPRTVVPALSLMDRFLLAGTAEGAATKPHAWTEQTRSNTSAPRESAVNPFYPQTFTRPAPRG